MNQLFRFWKMKMVTDDHLQCGDTVFTGHPSVLPVWKVKVDLVGLAQACCPELDLKAELERSFLSEPSSPGHTKATKGFRLGKHKHETFITSRFRFSVWLMSLLISLIFFPESSINVLSVIACLSLQR